MRIAIGQYELTLSSPPALIEDVIPTLTARALVGLAVVGPTLTPSVIAVFTYSSDGVTPIDLPFYIHVVDGS